MIEDIQKRRFLNNLYKLAYAYGNRIDEETVKNEYAAYFRQNPPGAPMSLEPENLRSQNIINIDFINHMMAMSIFNMDVLYDAVFESVEDLFSIVTSLNARIDSLRSRRASLENKIDDHIFSITNSDGYFASISEQFTDLSGIDTNFSNAFFDQDARCVTLPVIASSRI